MEGGAESVTAAQEVEQILINLKPQLKAVLEGINGIESVYNRIPPENANMPYVVFYEASNLPTDYYDGKEYHSVIEFVVQMYGTDFDQIDPLASAAAEAMQTLGYERTDFRDKMDGSALCKTMQYKTTI